MAAIPPRTTEMQNITHRSKLMHISHMNRSRYEV